MTGFYSQHPGDGCINRPTGFHLFVTDRAAWSARRESESFGGHLPVISWLRRWASWMFTICGGYLLVTSWVRTWADQSYTDHATAFALSRKHSEWSLQLGFVLLMGFQSSLCISPGSNPLKYLHLPPPPMLSPFLLDEAVAITFSHPPSCSEFICCGYLWFGQLL